MSSRGDKVTLWGITFVPGPGRGGISDGLPAWLGRGRLFVGHFVCRPDPSIASLWDEIEGAADELRQPVGGPTALLVLLRRGGRAADVLARRGMTAAAVEPTLLALGTRVPNARLRPAQPAQDRPSTLLSSDDAEALDALGIDYERIKQRVLEDFGPEALAGGEPDEERDDEPEPLPRRLKLAHRLKSLGYTQALLLGSPVLSSDHLLIALLCSQYVRRTLCDPLGIDAVAVQEEIRDVLCEEAKR